MVKPAHGTFGYKVYSDIKTFPEYRQALDKIFSDSFSKISERVVVEEQISRAQDYRLFCTPNNCLGVIHRVPAHVIGDGQNSLAKLVAMKNTKRVHKKLKLDDIALIYLEKNGLTINSVPKKGEKVFLRRAANTSAGGDCLQVTDEIHPSLKDLAVQATRAVPGLKYAGIDILSPDGTIDQKKCHPGIIEVNHSPDLAAFYYPDNKKPFDIVAELIPELFPENKWKRR